MSTSSLVSCLVSCLLYASFQFFVCDDAVVPITFQQVSLINQCWVRLRGDAHKKNATKILASSTKMKNSFTIFADELYLLGV